MIKPLYKAQAPFMEVKRGYGYQGVVMYDDAEDKVQCHICGGGSCFQAKENRKLAKHFEDNFGGKQCK